MDATTPLGGRLLTIPTSALLIFILALTALSYSNTLNSPLVLDDRHSFIETSKVYLQDLSPDSLMSLTSNKFGLNRLIPIFTFALNHRYSEGKASHYHLTNIAIHLLNGLVIYLFLLNLFKFPAARESLRFIKPSFLAIAICGLWTLSPVQTNAVTYLVQRMTSLATLFYISTLLFYLYSRQSSDLSRRLTWSVMAVLSFSLGALSKEIIATLPAAILLIEETIVAPGSTLRFIRKMPKVFWIVIFILTLLILPLTESLIRNTLSVYETRHFSLGERLLTEGRVVLWYISLLLLPLPSRMNLDHDFDISTSLLSPPNTGLSLVVLFLIALQGWKLRKEIPLFTFGIFWFFLNLVIESTFIALEIVFEHRLYLPSIGLFLALLALADYALYRLDSPRRNKELNQILVLAIIIVFTASSLLTTLRNHDWRDELSIYRDCAMKAPKKARTQTNYGLALARLDRYEEALPFFEKAISLGRPFYETQISASSNIILSLSSLGRNKEALERGKELFREIGSKTDVLDLAKYLHNLANIYYKEHEYALAVQALKSSIILSDPSENTLSIEFAAQILFAAAENDETRRELGMPQNVSRELASLIGLASILIEARNYDAAENLIRFGRKAAPTNKELSVLSDRLEELQDKNKAARMMRDIGNHPPYRNDLRYRLSVSLANFIMNHYRPLRPTVGLLLDWAAATQSKTDPFVELMYIRWAMESSTSRIPIDRLEQALAANPDFTPLLSLAFKVYSDTGLDQEAIAIGNQIMDIYPGNPQWQQLERQIVKLSKGQNDASVTTEEQRQS